MSVEQARIIQLKEFLYVRFPAEWKRQEHNFNDVLSSILDDRELMIEILK